MTHIQHVGVHSVAQLLKIRPESIARLYVVAGKHTKLVAQAQQAGVKIESVSVEQLTHLAGTQQHQGIGAASLVCPPKYTLTQLVASRGKEGFFLVLDNVQDPHNLGACLRTACAVGVDAVIIPERRACSVNATVSKVASGATAYLPVYTVTNLARTLEVLKAQDVWCVGTSEHAKRSLQEAHLTGALALVCGNEGSGLRQLTQKKCDELVSLPMVGPIQSLNVSVAVGMCLWSALTART